MRTRDQLLDMLSDALYVAPIVQTAKFHSQMNVQSYFYVFSYKTKSRDYIVSIIKSLLVSVTSQFNSASVKSTACSCIGSIIYCYEVVFFNSH